MAAELFMGVYFNLSFWYKLSDRTWWGAIMGGVGAAVMIAVNLFGVPRWGYMACAWGGFAGYGTAMLLSFFIGQKKYPIKYDMRMILGFFAFAMIIFAGYTALGRTELGQWPMMAIGTVLLLAYCVAVWKYVIRAR
jgi:O-antigen/teichoic acid export membrane protein